MAFSKLYWLALELQQDLLSALSTYSRSKDKTESEVVFFNIETAPTLSEKKKVQIIVPLGSLLLGHSFVPYLP